MTCDSWHGTHDFFETKSARKDSKSAKKMLKVNCIKVPNSSEKCQKGGI